MAAKLDVEFATSDGSPGVVYTLSYADEEALQDVRSSDLRKRIAKEFGLPVAPARLRLLLDNTEVLDRKARGRDFPAGGLKDGGRIQVRVGPAPKVLEPDDDDDAAAAAADAAAASEAAPEEKPKKPTRPPPRAPAPAGGGGGAPAEVQPPGGGGGLRYDAALPKEKERHADTATTTAAEPPREKSSPAAARRTIGSDKRKEPVAAEAAAADERAEFAEALKADSQQKRPSHHEEAQGADQGPGGGRRPDAAAVREPRPVPSSPAPSFPPALRASLPSFLLRADVPMPLIFMILFLYNQ